MTASQNTVHAGFIVATFNDTNLLERVLNDKHLKEKWDRLKMLMNGKYLVPDQVSLDTHNLFQEILDGAEERFGIKMPRSPEELL